MSPNAPDPFTYTPMYVHKTNLYLSAAHFILGMQQPLMATCMFLNTSSHKVSLISFNLNYSTISLHTPTGGNVNITDSDGDTPLFTIENIETARFLVEHGATVDIRNNEGISVRRYLKHMTNDTSYNDNRICSL